jgi:hypothetical protein
LKESLMADGLSRKTVDDLLTGIDAPGALTAARAWSTCRTRVIGCNTTCPTRSRPFSLRIFVREISREPSRISRNLTSRVSRVMREMP